MKQTSRFRHESLQDKKSIEKLLKAITEGLAAGTISLEDDEGQLVMKPNGLLHLKVSAAIEDDRNKLNIRISWDGDRNIPKNKPLKVKSK